jgi:hypothetical protein
VKQLDLANAELVRFGVLGVTGDLIDCFLEQLQIVMKVHELGRSSHPLVTSRDLDAQLGFH